MRSETKQSTEAEPSGSGLTPEQMASLPPDAKRLLIELNDKAAHAAHATNRTYTTARRLEAWNAASLILNSLATVNGGAIVAILALIGAMLSGGKVSLSPVDTVGTLAWFSGGLIAAIGGMVAAFFSCNAYIDAAESTKLQFERPYVVWTSKAAQKDKLGDLIRLAGIALVAVSLFCLVIGSFRFAIFAEHALLRITDPASGRKLPSVVPAPDARP